MTNSKKTKRYQFWIYLILIVMTLTIILPFLLVFISSITDETVLIRNGYSFFPEKISFYAYQYIIRQGEKILRAYGVTILITVVGTFFNLMFSALLAYPLSVKTLPYRRQITFFVFFTMLFNGGLVPTYLMYVNYFHIKNTIWALIVPNLLLSAMSVLLIRTYISTSIPSALFEAAKVDGAGEFTVFFKLVIPLSKPIIVTMGTFAGLGYWNDWTNGLYYLTDTKYYSIQNLLNKMWRNQCINDTYEPGSTFKVITAAAALEEGVVSLEDRFHCPGYIVVEDRRIRCHKTSGHGAESFVEGIENSCNPVFINVGLRIGADHFYDYFEQFGLLHKTGIDLPGEASTIMHKREKIGLVELATISFGQSFQITPIQLATTVSSIINGGNRVTPHVGMQVENGDKKVIKTFDFPVQEGICREETSEKMRFLLEKVVSEGGGNKAYIEGYEIGGKTATSQTLPRSAHKYISSFLGFAPADDPKVLVLVIIRNPSGIYYGGTIAAPVAKEIFENILPYLELEQ